jgi:hypothetical protein
MLDGRSRGLYYLESSEAEGKYSHSAQQVIFQKGGYIGLEVGIVITENSKSDC